MTGRFQFSLRFLLAATVAVAAGTTAARAQPSMLTPLASQGLNLLFATAAILGVYQTTGNVRVFWIGTSVVLCTLAVFSVQVLATILPILISRLRPGVEGGMGGWMMPSYDTAWPLWCAAPINGLFAVLLHWIFSSRKDAGRLPGTTIVALLLFLALLVATFFGGIQFGEWREGRRRDRQEQEMKDRFLEEMDEEAGTDQRARGNLPKIPAPR